MAINLLLAVAIGLVTIISPQTDHKRSLAGISSMHVLVEALNSEAKEDGLSESQLQTDAELKLRSAGIKLDPASIPHVYIQVTYIQARGQQAAPIGYVAFCRVSFHQGAKLDSTGIEMPVETWNEGGINTGPRSTANDNLRKKVGDSVDMFINNYLAVNPKR